MADLGFLRPQERRTVGLALAALACAGAGFWAHGFIAPAEAAQSSKVEAMAADIAQLNVNMARVMDRLGIDPEPKMPVRRSGVGR